MSRKEIIETVKQSLRNLGMEYIDLVIIHKYDVNCPIEGRNSLGNLRFHEKKKVFAGSCDTRKTQKSIKSK